MKKINEFCWNIRYYVYENPTEIIFGSYFFLIMIASVLVSILVGNRYGVILFATLVLYAVVSLVPKIHRGVLNVAFKPPYNLSKKKQRQVFGIASGITFTVLLICFIANYPGAFSPDSISQYQQAVTGLYNDWHPVWHTLLIFTLPLKLTGGWIGAVVLFQLIYFSLLIGYMALTIYLYAGYVYTCISVVFILLSPFTLEIVMYPWKDTAFAIAAGFSMLYAVNIYFTAGGWGKKCYRIVLLAFMLANATLFRHNGILFTFFLLIALFFSMQKQKKKWFLLIAITGLIFVCVKIPMYSYFNVAEPDKRIQEIMGLPLSVIVNVAKECPDRLDVQTMNFVTELMNKQPNWKLYHNISGFNSVKWGGGGINSDVIDKIGVKGILQMMCHCFVVAPKQSFMAVGGLTIPVYGLEIACRVPNDITKNNLGITYQGVKIISILETCYIVFVSNTPLRYVFSCIGSTILVMLAFILFKSNLKNFNDWKRIFLCLPIFTYNFGTMLLLTGHDVRFFYVSFIICPLVVLIMGGKNMEEIK